jgi:hypothetical protein
MPTVPSTATPCTDGAAPELLAMRQRLTKTQQSMKHKGVSAFSRAYMIPEDEEIGTQLMYPS